MLVKLVWENTGDEITFIPTFPDLLDYYINHLDQLNLNKFFYKESKVNHGISEELQRCLASIQSLSTKIPMEIDDWSGDVYDQKYLNKLHKQWVMTGIRYPNLPNLLKSMGNKDVDFRNINDTIHLLEKSFDCRFINYKDNPYQIKNIFGKNILSFNTTNLMLGFDNLGRSSWNKFINWDNNIVDTDTNDFECLSGRIELNLNRPLKIDPPIDYVNWCQTHGVPAVGNCISLGNIVDLDRDLSQIRKILVRNIHEQTNTFAFKICS
jgi:hypothetical protein